jgi:preprotein translocase subunit SecA
MFGQMIHGIAQDFVKYVMHVQVVVQGQPAPEPDVRNVRYTAAEDPVQGSGALRAAAAAVAEEAGEDAPEAAAPEPEPMQPVVRSEWEKTPRNAPCPCGSGKKFKLCHGK